MSRRRNVLLLAVMSAVALVAVTFPTAASAEQQVPLTLEGNPVCDTATGAWDVYYELTNYSPADVVIDDATDPTSGQKFAFTSTSVPSYGMAFLDRTVPGPSAQVTLSVSLHRVDRSSTIRIDRVATLPSGCVAQPAGAKCVNTSAARYRHTFDASAGTASVQIVGAPLCPGQTEMVNLESRGDDGGSYGNPYDQNEVFLTSSTSAVVLHVDVPSCHARVLMYFDVPYAHVVDDPSLMLGAKTSPGNRSTGPLADTWINGTSCHSAASAYISSNCDGTMSFHLTNAATANVSTEVKFEEFRGNEVLLYREVALEPGESAVITMTPPNVDGLETLYWHDTVLAQASYQRPWSCEIDPLPATPRGPHQQPGPPTPPRDRPSGLAHPPWSQPPSPSPPPTTAPSTAPATPATTPESSSPTATAPTPLTSSPLA